MYDNKFDSLKPCVMCGAEPGAYPNKQCKQCEQVYCTNHFIPGYYMGRADFIWFLHEKTCNDCCRKNYYRKRIEQPPVGGFTPCECCGSKEKRPKWIMDCDHCHKKCCNLCIRRFQVKDRMEDKEPAYEVCVKCQEEHGYFSRIGLDHKYLYGARYFHKPEGYDLAE